MNTTLPYRKIIQIKELSGSITGKMFSMLDKYYANSKYENFERDLSSKTAAICLFNPLNDQLIGFSTFREFAHTLNGQEYMLLYSGDTIIEKEFWGSQELVFGFLEEVFSMISRFPNHEIYWFLISKGIRTYKYLPTFMKEYYPNHKTLTDPKHQLLMDSVAQLLFPNLYDPNSGVIKVTNGQYLKEEYFPPHQRKNEIEEFYFSRNPGYVTGDELVCLAQLSNANIYDSIQRRYYTTLK